MSRLTVREELAEHEGVVGLGVLPGNANILVHVECDDIFEADLALLHKGDEVLVRWDGRRARGQAEDERL